MPLASLFILLLCGRIQTTAITLLENQSVKLRVRAEPGRRPSPGEPKAPSLLLLQSFAFAHGILAVHHNGV